MPTKGLSEREIEAVNQATRRVTNNLLHGPIRAIHEYARQLEDGAEQLAVIQNLFGNPEDSERDGNECG